jgi:hypothetical protein
MNQTIDRTGKKFGRWTVVEFAGFSVPPSDKTKRRSLWKCVCECGSKSVVSVKVLQDGSSQSCGCLQKERVSKSASTHRMSKTSLYKVWTAMKRRCTNPSDNGYRLYGARGITVSQRWLDSFEAFAADMGQRPERASLERIDNSRGYEPGNVRWATQAEQMRNTRRTVVLEFNGKRMAMKDWAAEIGICYSSLRQRIINGWSVEDALTKPIDINRAHRRRAPMSSTVSA